MKRETRGRRGDFLEVDRPGVTGNTKVSTLSIGALDRVMKESIVAELDDARLMLGVALKDSLKVAGGVFKTISSGSKDGGFLSMGMGKGVTKDA